MIREREATLITLVTRIAAALDAGARLPAEEREEHGGPIADALVAAVHLARDFVADIYAIEGMPDPLPAGWNRPAPANTPDVLNVLRAAAEHVAAGDSFEGTITWVMPTDEEELEGYEFGMVARYRVGNLDGQGGVKVYTHE